MQPTSSLYKELFQKGAESEIKVVIEGEEYLQDRIVSLKTSAEMFSGGKPGAGGTLAKQIDLVLHNFGFIPRMAEIRVYIRLLEGSRQTPWLTKGVYYIDTREEDESLNTLTIRGYDAILKTEQPFTAEGDQGEWPMTDLAVAREIAGRIGTTLDAGTAAAMNKGYKVEYPGFGEDSYTVREVLGFVGAMYGGNWVISDTGTLKLLRLGVVAKPSFFLTDKDGNPIVFGGGHRIVTR